MLISIPKAIELNSESYQSLADHGFHDHADAIKLSNEALKRLKDIRKDRYPRDLFPLPGETEVKPYEKPHN